MPTVLVVDDEPTIVELVRFTLEDAQVRVVEAGDGLEALRLASLVRPDVVLLDLRIPHLDGVEVCRRLRGDPALAQACIVMLTASADEADRCRGRAAGADEYLTKPFSPLALLRLVRAHLPEADPWPEA
jgi:two-component system, OmpR family, phosphate regulon response regulator PhoB